MLAHVARNTLELECHLDDFLCFFIGVDKGAEFWLFLESLFQSHTRLEGDQLGEFVRQRIGLALHPCYIANDRFRRQSTEGYDLRYRFLTVEFSHVLNDSVSTIHTEVDIKVRHGDTLGIQEALKKEIVLQRIKVGNLKSIGDDGSRAGATTGAYRYAVVFRPLDEFHHDEEVACEAHLVDDLQLECQAIPIGLNIFTALVFRTVK